MNGTRMFEKPNTPNRSVKQDTDVRRDAMADVLYVYNRVSTKENMRRRMHTTVWESSHENLSRVRKKRAGLSREVNRNLQQFYTAARENAKETANNEALHMGKVEDSSVRRVGSSPKAGQQTGARRPDSGTARRKTGPHMAGHTVNPGYTEKKRSAAGMGQARTQQGHPGMKHAHTAFTEDRTRVFKTPKMEGGGGAAVKTKPRSFFADLLESLDETWLRDVDLVKKQAILHKKFVEHRRGLALAVVICIIFGLFCGGIYELLFQVRSVDIQGSSLYDSRQVLAVSGLEMENMRMYDFRKQEVVDQITLHCPFIRSVTLERNLPDTVSLILEDDRIQYCANVFGEIVALSDSLRVLGTLGAAEAEQYVLLRLPEVTHAVAGRTLVFAEERDERYIRLVLSEMTGSRLADRISYIDLRDEHDVVMYCDGMYSLEFGNTADMKLKLRRAQTVIDDPDFPQNTPARVNLRVVSEASVRADLRLDLQVEP